MMVARWSVWVRLVTAAIPPTAQFEPSRNAIRSDTLSSNPVLESVRTRHALLLGTAAPHASSLGSSIGL